MKDVLIVELPFMYKIGQRRVAQEIILKAVESVGGKVIKPTDFYDLFYTVRRIPEDLHKEAASRGDLERVIDDMKDRSAKDFGVFMLENGYMHFETAKDSGELLVKGLTCVVKPQFLNCGGTIT